MSEITSDRRGSGYGIAISSVLLSKVTCWRRAPSRFRTLSVCHVNTFREIIPSDQGNHLRTKVTSWKYYPVPKNLRIKP